MVWQVKVIGNLPKEGGNIPVQKREDYLNHWSHWVDDWHAQADCKLKVRLNPGQAYTDPCTIAPDSMYRGQENQLYRVEIHTGGTLKDKNRPTFKWSRDNGSIAASWLGNSEDGGIIVSCARGFASGQWIEITSEANDLLAQTGQLVKIVRAEGDVLFLESPQVWDKNVVKKVRRWDQIETEDIQLPDGSEPIREGTTEADWIDLEDGIQVQFQPGGAYRTGDYWLIPARTVGTIEWPGDPNGVAPFGITHYYAPLWIISTDLNGNVTVIQDSNHDLRRKFNAIQ